MVQNALNFGHKLVTPPPNLRGRYGFITRYANDDGTEMSEADARARVRLMAQTYGIREFQFYDWFATYSMPTLPAGLWQNAWSHSYNIYENTIRIYIDEIHRQNGRAWAYVQAVAAEEYDLADDQLGIFKLIDSDGNWFIFPPPPPTPPRKFPCYFLNEAWAEHQVAAWAPTVRELGFDGIHWDTLGRVAQYYDAEVAGTHAFLIRAKDELERMGLLQTLNFSSSGDKVSWWDPMLAVNQTIAFPYFEAVEQETAVVIYAAMLDQRLSTAPIPIWGVLANYPEDFNRGDYVYPSDWSPQMRESEFMLSNWVGLARYNLTYLVLGDGERRLIGPYFPYNAPLTQYEREVMILDNVSQIPKVW